MSNVHTMHFRQILSHRYQPEAGPKQSGYFSVHGNKTRSKAAPKRFAQDFQHSSREKSVTRPQRRPH
eukprot:232192-Karenia_brevis.AAC.1